MEETQCYACGREFDTHRERVRHMNHCEVHLERVRARHEAAETFEHDLLVSEILRELEDGDHEALAERIAQIEERLNAR